MANLTEIVILCGQGSERLWVRALASRLECSLGGSVGFRITKSQPAAQRLPGTLDRINQGPPAPDLVGWFSTLEMEDLSGGTGPGCLIIDATDEKLGGDIGSAFALVLTPRFNGGKGTAGLMSALAVGGTPYVSIDIATAQGSREVLGTRIAVPDRNSTPAALGAIYARLITLIDAAVRHLLLGRPLPLTGPAPTRRVAEEERCHVPKGRAKALAWAKSLAFRLARPFIRTADWTIGIRRVDAVPVEQLDVNLETFFLMPCEYGHFYADPMIFTHDGLTYIFFEDYDYANKLGTLSCVTVDSNGHTSEPVEVMRRDTHLSYPFIYSHDGDIYMIPETGADRRVELWRAHDFPTGWTLCKILLSDVDAVDATVKFDPVQGIWWMFVSVAEPGGCTYDTLSIYFSDALQGEWKAHPLNPVKLDPSCSRPAGPIVEERGEWLRPAQDCTRRYGGSLAWCRITELTPETFHEEVVKRWLPPPGYRGLHTFTRADGWEAIDLQRRRWRWMPRGLFK